MASSPPAERLARAHRNRQERLAGRAVVRTRRLWRFGSWAAVSARVLAVVQAAMREAARGSQDYVTEALRLQGVDPDPYGQVVEAAFAETASDGRPLDSLLGLPAFEVQAFVDQGMPADRADRVGERHLERIVATQVQDAARVATGVAAANDRAVTGYVRHLTLPSCNRCIVLAGRWYRWSDGFKRHPQCDCVHVPAAESVDPPSPRQVYDRLTDEERRKAGWSGHDQRAIDDGADLNQVTNVRRKLRTVQVAGQLVKTTGVGFRGQRQRIRVTPEQIYADADRLGLSREQTLAALQRNGYIL